jgi:diguanylate cyclase (GGDEF)-like protein/PAS domain S-box-containing protein
MLPIKYFFGNVYVSASLGIAATLFVIKELQFVFGGSPPLLLFLVVIASAAWYGGLRAGLFATVLSAAASEYFLVEPYNSIYVAHSSEILRLLLLVTVGAICSMMIARLYKNEKQALYKAVEREEQLKQEITRRNRTRAERNLYATLAKSSTEFIGMCDTQGVPFFINDAGLRMVGLDSLEQGLKTPIREFFFPEDQPLIMEVFLPAVIQSGRGEIEVRFRHFKTGEALWMIYNVFALKDLNDNIVGLGTVSTDITLRKRAEEALRESQMDLKRAQAVAHIGSWRLDLRKNRLEWSDENFRIFGIPHGSFLTYESFLEIVHPADREFVDKAWKAALTGKPYDIEHRLIVGNKVKWVRELAELEFDEDGALRGGFGTTEDITDIKIIQEALQNERAFLRQVIDAAPSMIFVKDRERRFLLVNEALARCYGKRPKELIGFSDEHFNPHADEVAHFRQDDLEVFNTGKAKFIPQEKVTYSDGSVHWFSTVKIPLFDGDQCNKLLGVATDITERKSAEEAIKQLAFYDPLTQLPNRRLLQERLKHSIEVERREGKQLALLMIDLDRFKSVNDSLGHQAGDELLQQVAERITTRLRDADMVVRLGGDEFIVLLEDMTHPQDAARVAKDIIADLNKPFRLTLSDDVRIGASIGISLYPQHGDNYEILMNHADTALYQAKDQGRGCFAYFSEYLTIAAYERIALEARLRRAVQQLDLCILYQPQIDMVSGRIIGAEALVYWRDAIDGLIPPSRFIPIAEESGLIVEIGEWALREICKQGRQWLDGGLPPVMLSANISSHQLRRTDITALITAILAETGFPAKFLKLEITETGLMESQDNAAEILNRLRAQGVSLAIDDFGTGYSSLAYLKHFPIDVLKIDKSFIEDIPHNHDDMKIAATIVAMGHTLGFKVLAEGVETPQQLAFLLQNGCDMYQGFIKSRPLPAEEFARLLRNEQQGFHKTG